MLQNSPLSIKEPHHFISKQSSLYFNSTDDQSQLMSSQTSNQIKQPELVQQKPKSNNLLEDIPENIIHAKMGIKPKSTYSLEDNLQISLRLRYNKITMDKQKRQIIPGMVSILAKDFDIEKIKNDMIDHSHIDLIFVIDTSGSMGGQKIELVKKTVLQTLDFMKQSDRVAIIGFSDTAKTYLNLTAATDANSPMIQNVISNLFACGGTNIGRGMMDAFQMIKNRDYKNQVTSIFLLTDGQDSQGFQNTQTHLKQSQIADHFSIECFGYGSDHDSKLMMQISNLKQGTFNFISDIQKIEVAFSTVFAGLKSVVAQNIQIAIKFGNTSIMNGLKVKKTYGDQWIKVKSDNGYAIKLDQLLAGLGKDFVFLIELPPFEMKLPDQMRFQTIAVAQIKADCLNTNSQYKKTAMLTIELISRDQIYEKIDEDGEVMENYFRVTAGEAIEFGQKEAEKGKYKEGNEALQTVIDKITKTKYRNQSNMVDLLNDLKNCQVACQERNYNNFGQGYLLNANQQCLNQNVQMNCAPIFSNMEQIYKRSNNCQVITQMKFKKY